MKTKYSPAIAVCCALLILGAVSVQWLLSPVRLGQTAPVRFQVLSGQGTVTIARNLKSAQLIRSEYAFVFYARAFGLQSQLKAGTYEISPSMSTSGIVQLIASGKGLSDDIVVTIPEGSNVWEIDAIIASASEPIRPGQFARAAYLKEGNLFPETYRFAKEATVADVMTRVAQEFHDQAGEYTSQQVIIASMLEKEAKSADDMALVSGIIARRRELGMPLQLDATVAYGWCLRRWLPLSSNLLCDVTQAPIATEIKRDGPYNTYTNRGLPAGPISNPGLKALTAAKYPKASDYLYYLSTRDGSQIIYSKTLSEHLANRQKYLGF